MASETARIIDFQEYRRRLRPEPTVAAAAAAPMAIVWVPMMPFFAMMPTMPGTDQRPV